MISAHGSLKRHGINDYQGVCEPPENMRPLGIEPSDNVAKTLEYTHGSRANPPASVTKNVKRMVSSDDRLAAIIGAWPSLSEAVKAGIAAMVAASK